MKFPARLRRFQAAAFLLTLLGLLPGPLSGRDFVEAGPATVWKYLDERSAPAAGWRQRHFDDSKWKSGRAPLGYGESRLGTTLRCGELRWGEKQDRKPITAWFRHKFAVSDLKSGERLVLLFCLDDGAVVYLNGKEVARLNLPRGQVTADTPARRDLSSKEEGFYFRIPVPSEWVCPGETNLLAVEVHQASAQSDDLYFDLALKTLPLAAATPAVPAAAQQVMSDFHQRHYIGPGVRIPDGYIDGGRQMKLNAEGGATSGREILLVDRARDARLAEQLAFARSPELQGLPPLERAQRLAAAIDLATTPPGGARWVSRTVEQITREFANQPLLIGDVLDQCQAGVCRHRALLFKILADEAGLKAALVRGNYIRRSPPGFAHAWNEVFLDDGRRVLVDVMHNGGQPKFPDVKSRTVIARYARENDAPWYGPKADAVSPAK